MEALPPIPTPFKIHVRELRAQWVPPLIFVIGLIAAVILWRQYVYSPSMVGEVESITSNVTVPAGGTIADFRLNRFDHVSAGDVVAKVITTEPRIIEASLAVIRAEVAMIKASSLPLLGPQRNAMAYEHLRLDYLNERIALAADRVKLQYAETEYQRLGHLHGEKLVTDEVLEQSLRNRDGLIVQVEERNKIVQDMEPLLEEARVVNVNLSPTSSQETMRTTIAVQEEKLRLTEEQMRPVTIKAPIDGYITTVNHRNGENVASGAAIFIITSDHPERIVVYLRQPVMFEPQKGTPVEIRTRTARRDTVRSTILAVGTDWEPIVRPMQRYGPSANTELGLPIVVGLPPSLRVRPGELLDVTIVAKKN
jgi:multidrug resistance efflux pump